MTSSSRRTSIETVKHRAFLKSKNPLLYKSETRRLAVNMSLLSPEAQKAMIMTREDTKENISSAAQPVKTDNDVCNNNNYVVREGIQSLSKGKHSLKSVSSRIRGTHLSRRLAAPSTGTPGQTAAPRSRSTRSFTDRNHSISDNTKTSFNYSDSNASKALSDAVNSNNIKDNEIPLNKDTDLIIKPRQSQKQLQDSNDNSMNGNNDKLNNLEVKGTPEQQSEPPESFVLSLDRALDKKFIGRLRGDITNTVVISEPGKVRALDGGRLSNAQEVVVNVCHDDDRELTFNDEDEESLNNAKVVSEIRISLWMKYNDSFQPEDITDDIYIAPTEENNNTDRPGHAATTTTEQAMRGRSVDKTIYQRGHKNARLSNKNKWQTMKSDVNNNSGTLIKSKSDSSNNLRDASSTRTASTNRNDGRKASSRVSSLKTEKKS